MEVIYGTDGAKALNFSDLHVSSTTDDDSSVLLTNTNKLLQAVGISAKRIESTDELSRVASSLFVAVYESLFHQRINGIVRFPRTKDDYERNAQLVINCLSDQIQLDLKHITGRSIVSGDLRVLSNLVHILVRIVSLTSQESLTSYDSAELGQDRRASKKYRGFHATESHDSANSGGSISTHESDEPAVARDPYYLADAARFRQNQSSYKYKDKDIVDDAENAFGAHNGIVFNEDLKRSLAKMEQLMRLEQRSQAAHRRRETHLSVRQAASRAANTKHAATSREAMQRKWSEDAARESKSFALQRTSIEHAMLRQVYKGLLKRVVAWKVEERKEERALRSQMQEETAWHVQTLQSLFDERLDVVRSEVANLRAKGTAGVRDGVVKDELALAEDLLHSVAARNRSLLSKERSRLQHFREKEMLRRREAHDHVLSLMALGDWRDSLRKSSATTAL